MPSRFNCSILSLIESKLPIRFITGLSHIREIVSSNGILNWQNLKNEINIVSSENCSDGFG